MSHPYRGRHRRAPTPAEQHRASCEQEIARICTDGLDDLDYMTLLDLEQQLWPGDQP